MSTPVRVRKFQPAAAPAICHGWVTVRRGRAHYAEAGDGPPVVLAAGLGLSIRFYEPALATFAEAGLRLIVPDLPGCGRTPGPATGCAVPQLAEWLIGFADALELEAPAWLGHSIGCQVALDLAARAPERAGALVLAGPTGAPIRHRLLRQVAMLPRAAVREPAALIGAVLRDYVRVLPSAYLGSWLRAGWDQPTEKLERVRCPTLVLVGERDPVPAPQLLARLRYALRSGRIVQVRGGGHGLPRDAVEAFTAAAAPFLHAHAERGTAPRAVEGVG